MLSGDGWFLVATEAAIVSSNIRVRQVALRCQANQTMTSHRVH